MLEQTLFSITACDRQTDRRIPTAITRISTAWTDAYKKTHTAAEDKYVAFWSRSDPIILHDS